MWFVRSSVRAPGFIVISVLETELVEIAQRYIFVSDML